MRWLGWLVSHWVVLVVGIAIGIYWLPILTKPVPADLEQVHQVAAKAQFNGRFDRNRIDSDLLHWGEGSVFIAADAIALRGELAPGPNYQLYLSPRFVETEAEFLRLKASMVHVAPVPGFGHFTVAVPSTIDVSQFSTVIVWCEAFNEFITSARYQ
ncbi:DM13 domain-containing protein [Ferrimonas sp. SCSIO 43195]|uniref:DM13 domain-containing protein n=1 Tax=Ferrimonas sp. SCSIO 43195 TaxID=2822844 RepID=UPI002075F79C|nr:DM13 domain-containing protein [Ferrimonas sp. SCSIO 43195]USD39076.1 DM13 domain-containing protein [Ferrimonas sp. SCSIO 43195]